MRFRARAQGQFRFRATPRASGRGRGREPLQLSPPEFSPDISSDGLLLGEWLPLPVLNTGTAWLRDLKVAVTVGGLGSSESIIALHQDYMQVTNPHLILTSPLLILS